MEDNKDTKFIADALNFLQNHEEQLGKDMGKAD